MAGIFLRITERKSPTALHPLAFCRDVSMASTPISVPGANHGFAVTLTLLSPGLTSNLSSFRVSWTSPLPLQCHILLWISSARRPNPSFFPSSVKHFGAPIVFQALEERRHTGILHCFSSPRPPSGEERRLD